VALALISTRGPDAAGGRAWWFLPRCSQQLPDFLHEGFCQFYRFVLAQPPLCDSQRPRMSDVPSQQSIARARAEGSDRGSERDSVEKRKLAFQRERAYNSLHFGAKWGFRLKLRTGRESLTNLEVTQTLHRKLWRWLTAQIVQNVPEADGLCEFDCRKQQCAEGEWALCERRHRRAGGELWPESSPALRAEPDLRCLKPSEVRKPSAENPHFPPGASSM